MKTRPLRIKPSTMGRIVREREIAKKLKENQQNGRALPAYPAANAPQGKE